MKTIEQIEGTTTLSNGEEVRFRVYRDPSTGEVQWHQWGSGREELGTCVEVLEAMAQEMEIPK